MSKQVVINVDLGAKYNGVYLVLMQNEKIIDKYATNITISNDTNLSFSKNKRLQYRHSRRGNDRGRFYLRLLREIFNYDLLEQNEIELIQGLLKNRGFNYLNVEFDDISDEDFELLKSIDGYEFKNCKTKKDFENAITNKTADYDANEAIEFFDEQIEILKNRAEDNKKIKTIINKINKLFDSTKNEFYKNAKHRIKYLENDIKNEINSKEFKNILSKLQINSDEFYCLIGNISNFQTRILRRYFNGKFNDKFDDEKLKIQILKNINYSRYLSDLEKNNEQIIRENLKKYNALDFLKFTNPVITIPPYENRKNKNPQTCDTLVINDEKLKDKDLLLSAFNKLLKFEEYQPLLVDEYGQVHSLDIENLAFYLQRFFDSSKRIYELNEDMYPRNLNYKNVKFFKENLNSKEFSTLQKLAKEYYNAVDLAKKGITDEGLLKICGKHTPHKNKNPHILLSAAFGVQLTKKDISNLRNYLNTEKIIGNKTFLAFFEKDLKELKNEYGNSLFKIINDSFSLYVNNSKEPIKDIFKILKNIECVCKKIKEHNKELPIDSKIDEKNISTNLHYLLQISDILFDTKNRGFLKTCYKHTLENLLRSSKQQNLDFAIATRLPANSARLINGKVEAYLDRLAYEIVNVINSRFPADNIDEILINLEMNKFKFEESANDINLVKSKQSKGTKPREFICPYSGEKIDIKSCEYDHILPRSRKRYDSEANLVPVSSSANLIKGNKTYLLKDLNKKYLEDVYKKINVKNLIEFEKFIDNTIAQIKDYTNYKNLNFQEKIAFRHALFLESSSNSYKIALDLLQKDKIRAYSNGTQKRFTSILISKARRLLKTDNLSFKANFFDSKLVNAARNELLKDENAKKFTNFKKQNFQDLHSHCIDASIVFYLSDEAKNMAYFDEIYPKYSKVINPESKKFLLLDKSKIDSKSLFDDSVYSLVYEINGLNDKNKNILLEKGLLFEKVNGKKGFIKELNEGKIFIDTHKVFDTVFQAFESRDIDALKEISFLDNHIKNYIKKDIFDIYFNKGKFIDKLKNKTKVVEKFHQILKENIDKLYIKDEDEKEKINTDFIIGLYKKEFIKDNKKRKRNKNKVTYSLPVAGQAGYVIRRNGGYAGLKNGDIATRTYFDIKNTEILKAKFYSKNVLPLKIKDIISIVDLEKIDSKKMIYEVDIVKNLPNAIKSLKLIMSQDSRHDVAVYFDKNKIDFNFDDIGDKFDKDNLKFKEFIDKYLNDEFKDFLGKPRNSKANIVLNTDSIFAIKYCVETTTKDNKKIIAENLKDETFNT